MLVGEEREMVIPTRDSRMSDAGLCRENSWKAGTRLGSDEGHGPIVIEITAVGESKILAKVISHNGRAVSAGEMILSLRERAWARV